jgi:hypothetical protein
MRGKFLAAVLVVSAVVLAFPASKVSAAPFIIGGYSAYRPMYPGAINLSAYQAARIAAYQNAVIQQQYAYQLYLARLRALTLMGGGGGGSSCGGGDSGSGGDGGGGD